MTMVTVVNNDYTAVAAAAGAKTTLVTVADNNNTGNLVGAPVVIARKVPWKDDWPWCN